MESTLNKPLVGNLVYSLLGKRGSGGWHDMPTDWSDIRTDCPANSIALYAGHEKLDFTGYDYVVSNGKLVWANPNIYLKGDENSCILTDYAPSYKTSMDIKVGDVNNWICGARNSVGTIDFGIAYYLAAFGKNILQFTNISSGTHTFNYGQTLIKDGVTIGTFPDTTSVNTVPFLLFGARTEENTNIALSSGKIYYCKIYDNGTLVRHFVPVPQGLVIGNFTCPSNGMFDIVNQQFYANQGTGNFTYGGADPSNLNIKTSVQYDNLGFIANCTGGYNVFIDGTQYGTTYASGTRCNITWSTSGITTGDDITTPSTLKAHKIWVVPATLGDNFYSFRSNRVASSGTEEQGLLWTHFNFKNNITLNKGFSSGDSWTYFNKILQAVTAKNNIISLSTGTFSISAAFYNCEKLEYLPVINGNNGTFSSYEIFCNCKSLKKLVFKNLSFEGSTNICTNCYNLEEFKYNGSDMQANPQAFTNCYKLNKTPAIAKNGDTNSLNEFITNASSLEDTIFDFSGYDNVTLLRCYGSISNFMTGFKGLRVSSSAPFNYQYGPQIDVSYTGMDRAALVQLFNDLPYNVGYTVSSGPAVVNGLWTKEATSDRCYTSASVPLGTNDFEWQFLIGGPNNYVMPAFNTLNGRVFARGSNADFAITIGADDNNTISISTDEFNWKNYKTAGFYIKCSRQKQEDQSFLYTFSMSADGITWVDKTGTTTSDNYDAGNKQLSFLQYVGNDGPAGCFIDFSKSYYKINNIYWFRGQPAMTKTLSCVGATGTADLTAEDKDIALNKGWSLTLS